MELGPRNRLVLDFSSDTMNLNTKTLVLREVYSATLLKVKLNTALPCNLPCKLQTHYVLYANTEEHNQPLLPGVQQRELCLVAAFPLKHVHLERQTVCIGQIQYMPALGVTLLLSSAWACKHAVGRQDSQTKERKERYLG